MSNNLKAIIFDVDGTLYRPIPIIDEALHNYWVERIAQHEKTTHEVALDTFRKLKSQYKSSTRVMEVLGLGDTFRILKQAEKFLSPWIRQYLKRDRDMIQLIKKLRAKYAVYTLRNGTKVGTRITLQKLGFQNKRPSHVKGFGPFDDILSTAELGVTKPHPFVFENVMKQLKINPAEIVMVGDRFDVDLAPAKKVGMKTVLVTWGNETGPLPTGVDAAIETIYDMKELL